MTRHVYRSDIYNTQQLSPGKLLHEIKSIATGNLE